MATYKVVHHFRDSLASRVSACTQAYGTQLAVRLRFVLVVQAVVYARSHLNLALTLISLSLKYRKWSSRQTDI